MHMRMHVHRTCACTRTAHALHMRMHVHVHMHMQVEELLKDPRMLRVRQRNAAPNAAGITKLDMLGSDVEAAVRQRGQTPAFRSARALRLRLLRAPLAALGGAHLPARETGPPLGAQPPLRVPEPSHRHWAPEPASSPLSTTADPTAFCPCAGARRQVRLPRAW